MHWSDWLSAIEFFSSGENMAKIFDIGVTKSQLNSIIKHCSLDIHKAWLNMKIAYRMHIFWLCRAFIQQTNGCLILKSEVWTAIERLLVYSHVETEKYWIRADAPCFKK